jgi:hypothetical protein
MLPLRPAVLIPVGRCRSVFSSALQFIEQVAADVLKPHLKPLTGAEPDKV